MSELRLNTITDKNTDKGVNVDALHYQNTQLVRSLGSWQPGLVFENKTDYATYNDQAIVASGGATLPYTTQGSDPTSDPDVGNVVPFAEGASPGGVFDSVEKMKEATLSSGQVVRTKGYHSPGDGGDAEYLIVPSSTGTSDEGLYIELPTAPLQAFLLSPVTSQRYGMVGGVDESDKMQALCSTGNKVVMAEGGSFIFDSTVTIPDNTEIDLNGASILANHEARMFEKHNDTTVVGLKIYNGTLSSNGSIDGPYTPGNEAFRGVDCFVNDVHFDSWANAAWRAVSNCRCPRMTFDNIRGNPVVADDGSTYGTVAGGDCGGDAILFKGDNNRIEYLFCDNVGWRGDDTDFVAGAVVSIGAGVEGGNNCYVGYAECDVFGAWLVITGGGNNKIGTVKARKSHYPDGYPGAGSRIRPAETASLDGADNIVDALIITESVARGIRIGQSGLRTRVRSLDIEELLVGTFINVTHSGATDCEVTRAVCRKSPNAKFLMIRGNRFQSELIRLTSGHGGGEAAGVLDSEFTNIGSLMHSAEYETSSGEGYHLTGYGGNINYLEVTGFGGCVVDNYEFAVGRYFLTNNFSAYDNILKIRPQPPLIITGAVISDFGEGAGDRSPIAIGEGLLVVFKNNISADMVDDGSSSVINGDNY